jgi:hypothetical protein
MRQIAEFVAVLSCSLFTGASVYINLVEHPARMECGRAVRSWQESYRESPNRPWRQIVDSASARCFDE